MNTKAATINCLAALEAEQSEIMAFGVVRWTLSGECLGRTRCHTFDQERHSTVWKGFEVLASELIREVKSASERTKSDNLSMIL